MPEIDLEACRGIILEHLRLRMTFQLLQQSYSETAHLVRFMIYSFDEHPTVVGEIADKSGLGTRLQRTSIDRQRRSGTWIVVLVTRWSTMAVVVVDRLSGSVDEAG